MKPIHTVRDVHPAKADPSFDVAVGWIAQPDVPYTKGDPYNMNSGWWFQPL